MKYDSVTDLQGRYMYEREENRVSSMWKGTGTENLELWIQFLNYSSIRRPIHVKILFMPRCHLAYWLCLCTFKKKRHLFRMMLPRLYLALVIFSETSGSGWHGCTVTCDAFVEVLPTCVRCLQVQPFKAEIITCIWIM